MALQFVPAVKAQRKLRAALIGPSGSGKTYTALKIAAAMGGKIAVIDSEQGSASLYAEEFKFDTVQLGMDDRDTEPFHPHRYIEAIRLAEQAGYDVIIIDSLSHAWQGKGGVLDIKDKLDRTNKGQSGFDNWRKTTPIHNELVLAITSSKCHIIATMRSKTEYVMEEYTNKAGGKSVKPVKVGLAPIQRDGLEYEFDVIGILDHTNVLHIDKTRCAALSDKAFEKAGSEIAAILSNWLGDGAVIDTNNRNGLLARFKELRNQLDNPAPLTKAQVDAMNDDAIRQAIAALELEAAQTGE